MPKALLLDLDGVLRRWPPLHLEIERSHGLPAGAIPRAAFAPDLLQAAVTGQLSDPEWRVGIARDLAAHCPHEVAVRAVAAWSAHPGEIDREVLALVDRCSRRMEVVLVTNATSRLSEDLAVLGLRGRFPAINSSEIGVAKPDPRIYEAALERAGARAEEALFADDSVANVRAAEALGIAAHHFTDLHGFEEFLRRYGVL